jgi:hypothetical protein
MTDIAQCIFKKEAIEEVWKITGRYCSLEINREQESVWYTQGKDTGKDKRLKTETEKRDSST